MENNIRIVRFKDFSDVICKIDNETQTTVDIEDPMWFEIRNAHLVINQWLPSAISKNNFVTVKLNDILCIYEPNKEFEEYYLGLIQDLKEGIAKVLSKEDRIEEAKALLDTLEEMTKTKNLVRH